MPAAAVRKAETTDVAIERDPASALNTETPAVTIACTTDRRFAELAGVMLASLFRNGEVGGWRVVVIGYRLRERDKARLRQSCGADGERLEFIDVDPKMPEVRRLLPTRFALSPAPYLRLLIPSLLAGVTGRVIYLDADTLVLSSLRPLAHTKLEKEHVLAAAEDDASTHPRNDGRIPSFPPDRPYFNSGVLLIDLDGWRDQDVTRRAFAFIAKNEHRLAFADQDVLNAVLCESWRALAPEWNYTHHRASKGDCASAHVVHFTGNKPWSNDCLHPAKGLFLQYRAETPWRHRRMTTHFERRMGKWLNKRAARLKRFWMKRLGWGWTAPGRPEAGS